MKAQQILVTRGTEFKHISSLAVVVQKEVSQGLCGMLFDNGTLICGHYDFLYRDYEEDFSKRAVKLSLGEQNISKCAPLSTESKFTENKKIMQEMAEALGAA